MAYAATDTTPSVVVHVCERSGERGKKTDGKTEETEAQNYPDQEARVHAHPLKLNRRPDEDVLQTMLAKRHLLLWKQPVTALEAAAVTAVAEIPVHVAQKRIEASSLVLRCASVSVRGSWPGPSQSLSLG